MNGYVIGASAGVVVALAGLAPAPTTGAILRPGASPKTNQRHPR